MLKAVILIGGPQKGTRFRPLSFDIPKPLFPVTGLPVIQHHIEACKTLKAIDEIIIMGFYPVAEIESFVERMQTEYEMKIRYLKERNAFGTAGGLRYFREEILSGDPEAVFVMNGDVCSDFPLEELYQFHKEKRGASVITIMGTEATKHEAVNYGCLATNKETHEVTHYVEKPNTYVSALINCGVYLFSIKAFDEIERAFTAKQQDSHRNGVDNSESEYLQLEQNVLTALAGTGKLFVLETSKWWCQLKTAGSAIYANRCYLNLYKARFPERLTPVNKSGDASSGPKIIADVFIHPTAKVHNTAVLGPNVAIGKEVIIGAGVRVRESIVLDGAMIGDHSLILHSIIGRGTRIGEWTRVEGTPSDPDPNKPFAKMENNSLFNCDGRLHPSITILGCQVTVPSETVLLNSIVLPNKQLSRSLKNEIIL